MQKCYVLYVLPCPPSANFFLYLAISYHLFWQCPAHFIIHTVLKRCNYFAKLGGDDTVPPPSILCLKKELTYYVEAARD